MPVHAIDPLPTPGDFRAGLLGVWLNSTDRKQVNVGTIRSSMPPNQRNSPTAVAAAVTTALQNLLDVRISRSSLPADDPDLLTDPARPDLFWDGLDLVGRSVKVTVTWNAATTSFELRLERVGGQDFR